MSDYVRGLDNLAQWSKDWLDELVECPWCGNQVKNGDRVWLDGDCLCPECYQHKRHKYYD